MNDVKLSFIDDEPEVFRYDWPADCPKPGMYEAVPFDEYLKWPAVSQSGLKVGMDVSGRHLQALLNHELEDEPTPAKELGSAIHTAIFEPERYAKEYLRAGSCKAILKTGDRKGSPCGNEARRQDADGRWLCGVHGKEFEDLPNIVSNETADRCEKIVAAVKRQPISALLQSSGNSELSIVTSVGGIPLKCRLDFYYQPKSAPPIIVDLKSCQPNKGAESHIQKTIVRYMWAMQAYAYCKAVEDLTGDVPRFAWMFIESGGLYEPAVYQLDDITKQLGKAQFDAAWQRYYTWLSSGYWPSYNDQSAKLQPLNVVDTMAIYWECQRWGVSGG